MALGVANRTPNATAKIENKICTIALSKSPYSARDLLLGIASLHASMILGQTRSLPSGARPQPKFCSCRSQPQRSCWAAATPLNMTEEPTHGRASSQSKWQRLWSRCWGVVLAKIQHSPRHTVPQTGVTKSYTIFFPCCVIFEINT